MQLARRLIGSYSSKVRAGRKRLHHLTLSPSPSDVSAARALMDHMPRKSKSSRCHYCTKVRHPTLRRKSVWYCAACDGQPTLCLTGFEDGSDCFRIWHTTHHWTLDNAPLVLPLQSYLFFVTCIFVIESADCNVGISRTCNIWQYKKISLNLKNGKLI